MPNDPLNTPLSPALRELEEALRGLSPADRGPEACRVFYEMGRASMRRHAHAWRWGASACAAGLALALAIPAMRGPSLAPSLPPVPSGTLALEPDAPDARSLVRLASRSRSLTGGLDAVDALTTMPSNDHERAMTASEWIESGRAGDAERVSALFRLFTGVVR